MKAEINKNPGFKPIEVTITIETVDELRVLLAKLNTPASDVNGSEIKGFELVINRAKISHLIWTSVGVPLLSMNE